MFLLAIHPTACNRGQTTEEEEEEETILRCSTCQSSLGVRSSAVCLELVLWPLGGSSAPGFPPPRSSKQQTELRSKRGERTSETASDRDF